MSNPDKQVDDPTEKSEPTESKQETEQSEAPRKAEPAEATEQSEVTQKDEPAEATEQSEVTQKAEQSEATEQRGAAQKAEAADVATGNDETSPVIGEDGTTELESDPGISVDPEEAEVSIESLQAQLALATEETDKYKDVALRAEAEMQNVRRRATKDLENAHKYGTERFVKNLLPVIDGLDKAIESVEQAAENGANKAIIDGVSLCHKMLLEALGKDGVTVLNPLGEPFDPNVHQAMSMVENPDVEPNSVVMVVQKGYMLNERLVRPAMVMVSKGTSPNIDEMA